MLYVIIKVMWHDTSGHTWSWMIKYQRFPPQIEFQNTLEYIRKANSFRSMRTCAHLIELKCVLWNDVWKIQWGHIIPVVKTWRKYAVVKLYISLATNPVRCQLGLLWLTSETSGRLYAISAAFSHVLASQEYSIAYLLSKRAKICFRVTNLRQQKLDEHIWMLDKLISRKTMITVLQAKVRRIVMIIISNIFYSWASALDGL